MLNDDSAVSQSFQICVNMHLSGQKHFDLGGQREREVELERERYREREEGERYKER